MIYRVQEGHLSLNGEWRDQSVNVLVPAEAAVKGANLVLARDALPLGMTLADYVAQQRTSFRKQLTGFELVRDVDGAIDARPAHFLEFTWRNDGNPLHQMVMTVQDQTRLLNFTASIPGTADAETRRLLMQAISSFKFAAETGA